MTRRLLTVAFAAAAVWPALAQMTPMKPAEPALGGYDPVAYFTQNEARQGEAARTAEHKGKVYRFASEENREKFRQDPGKYLPQFGGQCAWAVSHNYLYPGDPSAFTVYEGRLFLNANQAVSKKFQADIARLTPLADQNWQGLREKAGKEGKR
jgi:YHS domain-containing protein